MFIGSEYRLCDQENRTLLGYKTIVIKERVLSRTETRSKMVYDKEAQRAGDVEVTSYHYTLLCLVDGGDSAELDEGQLQDEIICGLYELEKVT